MADLPLSELKQNMTCSQMPAFWMYKLLTLKKPTGLDFLQNYALDYLCSCVHIA